MNTTTGSKRKRTEPTALSLNMIPVWKQMTPELKGELLSFWTDSKAIPSPAHAAERTDQGVAFARNSAGIIQAVTTAHLAILPRLRHPLYYFRMFLSKDVRGQGFVIPFYNYSRDVLQKYNASLAAPESIGILIELESQILATRYRRVHVAEAAATFIGYSPMGLHLYVSYFDGATLLTPSPGR